MTSKSEDLQEFGEKFRRMGSAEFAAELAVMSRAPTTWRAGVLAAAIAEAADRIFRGVER
jgi:hypothetical protein